MIAAKLSEISWGDIEALVATGREEDDTIEFKSSFKGAPDYLALNDAQKAAALESIAREVVAFLNTRGGDVIIGIREEAGERPRASEIELVHNPVTAAERISRGLAALIEPAQTNVIVRGIEVANNPQLGVIVVRVLPSLRAPHRLRKLRECFARRGSESVPMAMDEIQDLTLNRSRLRLEQQELLDRQFEGFGNGDADNLRLAPASIHLRCAAMPFLEQNLELNHQVLSSLSGPSRSYVYESERETLNDVAFRGLRSDWKPILRGRAIQHRDERTSLEDGETFLFGRKALKQNGIALWDFAFHYVEEGSSTAHINWVVGYLAGICADLERLATNAPSTFPITLKIGVRVARETVLSLGSGFFRDAFHLPTQLAFMPDFVLNDQSEVSRFFEQAQEDFLALAGLSTPIARLAALVA